jgi:hypothetical protein
VKTHRAELAAALRLYRDRDGESFGSDLPLPVDVVEHAAIYRDLASASGDAAEAERWQAIIDRFAPVLADRRKMVAFSLLAD